MNVLLYLVRKTRNKHGESPLYLRFTHDKKRAEVFTRIYTDPTLWDDTNKRITGVENREKNSRIDNLLLSIKRIQEEHQKNNYHPSAVVLKEAVEKLIEEEENHQPDPTFLELVDLYMTDHEAKISQQTFDCVTRATFRTYKVRRGTLTSFLTAINKKNIRPDSLDKHVINSFINWGIAESFEQSTINRHIKFFRTVLKYGFENKLCAYNPLTGVKLKEDYKEVVYLSESEIKKIAKHSFSTKRLERVADLFVFQCYTGFSYIDLMNFDVKQHLKQNSDGTFWIRYSRNKSKIRALIPLFNEPQRILNKYEGQLPHLANETYNTCLKDIAVILGIKEWLTTHVARKTCGTVLLNAGFSLESVARVLGHASIKTTEKIYTEVLEERMLLDFAGKTNFSLNLATKSKSKRRLI